ncbi:MAG: hypothetical protein ACE5R4_17020 [Armatimonadota bacterium]
MPNTTLSLIFAALGVFFCAMAGGSFVLMGLELRRRGRPTQFLSLSFSPRERIRVAAGVFDEYRRLKQDHNETPILPYLVWTAVALVVVCFVGSLVVLARGG